jgi:hypothetical protein
MTFDPSKSPLPGPNILLMGEGGTGKTYSIGTLVDRGLEVFYLALESGLESLLGYWSDRDKPVPENLHWHKLAPPKMSYKDFADQALRINTINLKTLAESPDPNRHLHNQWIALGGAMYDFPDDRTGKKFGPVDSWGPERVIVIDGMTGLCKAAMSAVTGSRPVWNPMDYQIGQKQVEGFLRMTCDNTRCWFILISHVEKEIDPVNGGLQLMVSGIGKALSPLVPPMFSDVVWCKREGTKWTWNTASSGVATKARNLPWADGLPQDFEQVYSRWQGRAKSVA